MAMIMILGVIGFALLTVGAFLTGFKKVGLALLICTGIGLLANALFYVAITNSSM